jgi:hypothetical protein
VQWLVGLAVTVGMILVDFTYKKGRFILKGDLDREEECKLQFGIF